MKAARSASVVPTLFTSGAKDIAPTSFQWYGAVAIGMLLVIVALLAVLFGRAQGPEVKPLIPLAAGIWSISAIITAFLLLAQF